MKIKANIDDELFRSFNAARVITGETEEEAIVAAISSYTRSALMRGAASIRPGASEAEGAAFGAGGAGSSMRQEFVAWFKQQKAPGRNKPYNPVTISGYAGRIQNACQGPGFESVEAGNLFEIDDPKELSEVVAQMRSCPAYAEYDVRAHNGLTASLKKYAEFLSSRSQVDLGGGAPRVAHSAPAAAESVPSRPESKVTDAEQEAILASKSKAFAMKCLKLLEERSAAPEDDIEVLTDARKCNEATRHEIPILKPTQSEGKASKSERVCKGAERYYADVVTLWGRRFIVSREWSGPGDEESVDNRAPFFHWVMAHEGMASLRGNSRNAPSISNA